MLFFPELECLFVSEPSIFDSGLFLPIAALNLDRRSAFLSFLSVDNCSKGLSEDQIKINNQV